jgi:hypothetical protein
MWAVPRGRGAIALCAVRVVFFVELLILVFRWIIATHDQFAMWVLWLDNPFVEKKVYAALIGLPTVLGLLLAFPHKILFISGFMTVCFLVNYWTQWLSNDHFNSALLRTRGTPMSDAKSGALEAMECFWLKRPQLGRIVIMMFFSSIAFNFALAGVFLRESSGLLQQFWTLGAYAILILDVLISEIVVAWWRYRLARDINRVRSIISEGGALI